MTSDEQSGERESDAGSTTLEEAATGATFQVRINALDEGRTWYERLLGREPDFVVQDGFVEWELVPGSNCWLQVAEGEATPGNGPLRLGTSDIEAELARLQESLGIEVPDVHRAPDDIVRYCTFTDPFGNRIGLFEE